MDIGSSVKLALAGSDCTQREISQITGISQTYLSQIKCGQAMPTMRIIIKLSRAFDLRVSEFIALGETK